MKTNNTPKYRFLEVGISISGVEFYLVFAVPYSLVMRRPKTGGTICNLSVEDWLDLEFPSLLAYQLNIPFNLVRCIHIMLYSFDKKHSLPIYNASSLPSSWVSPFINLIAQTYANEIVSK